MNADQALRLWRLAPWSRNPLMRATDRFDSVAAVVMITLILIAVPFAAALGTATYTGLNEQSHSELQTRHAQSAVLIDDPRLVIIGRAPSRSPETQDRATAQWTAPDGALRSTVVDTKPGMHRGDTVDVWVDRDGNVVDEPRSGVGNAEIAVSAALSAWSVAAVCSFVLYMGVRWMNRRSQMRHWDQEWKDFGRTPGWPVS
ncbi:hypothetical protein CJ179_33830 [Rhodococcus sp. ACS1]|jgi:hypothetical protein|uniref:Rv1733c family protein n=1 Tax=Rhodococcus sp. ACS1 TaxID=2028570 RepID=UPI000BB0FF84|nr:hypothetical protein [Rhodococcus sp. ACS1]PBC40069.1 hypothetical protein CJ179_33830 [Rhodococcus sp. ACS1]